MQQAMIRVARADKCNFPGGGGGGYRFWTKIYTPENKRQLFNQCASMPIYKKVWRDCCPLNAVRIGTVPCLGTKLNGSQYEKNYKSSEKKDK